MGFNQRELRLIRARPRSRGSRLLTVTHMSHGSSRTAAVSSADCGSRDLNARSTHARPSV